MNRWKSLDWWSGVAVSVALSAFAAAMVLTYGRARPEPVAVAEDEPRFYGSDTSVLGRYQSAWMVRDRLRPGRCVLVVEVISEAGGSPAGGARAVTSQIWPCS